MNLPRLYPPFRFVRNPNGVKFQAVAITGGRFGDFAGIELTLIQGSTKQSAESALDFGSRAPICGQAPSVPDLPAKKKRRLFDLPDQHPYGRKQE
jgi:hypothetical protein